jgi:hypothetical protein
MALSIAPASVPGSDFDQDYPSTVLEKNFMPCGKKRFPADMQGETTYFDV